VLSGLLRDKGLQSSTMAPWPSLQNFGAEDGFFRTDVWLRTGQSYLPTALKVAENGLFFSLHSHQLIPAESLLTLAMNDNVWSTHLLLRLVMVIGMHCAVDSDRSSVYAAGGRDWLFASEPNESRRKESIPRRTALISSGSVTSGSPPPTLRDSICQRRSSVRSA
jgi:hypothetical protein